MRDENRIKPFLEQFEKLWLLYPDCRFGQLIYLLADKLGKDIFFPEEDEWLTHIDDLIAEKEEWEKNNPKSDEDITKDELYQVIEELLEKPNKNKYKIKGGY